MDGDAWRNKGKIQVIAVIDVVLGVLFIVFSLYYAITFLAGLKPLPAEELSVHLGRFLVLLAGALVFVVNGWQIYVAILLLKALRPDEDELDDNECVRSGRRWLKTSLSLLLVIAVKFFLLCLVPLGENNNFDFFMCLFEFIFRIAGLYFVKELLDDLAAEAAILTRAASVRSRKSAPTPRSEPSSPPSTNIEIPLTDFTSNTTMKVTTNAVGHADAEPESNAVAVAVINTHQAQVQH